MFWKFCKQKPRQIICPGNVALVGDRTGTDSYMVGRPGRKRPLGRLRRRCEDNINMGLQGVSWGVRD